MEEGTLLVTILADPAPTDNKSGTDHLADYADLDRDHAQELFDSAVTPAVAAAQGVRTARTQQDLPDWAHWIVRPGEASPLPAVVYPMTEADGSPTGQVKPVPGSVVLADGRAPKYVGPPGSASPKLPVLRAVADPEVVFIVEGVKQALAALSWAPETWSIYRIAGINSWMVAGKDGEKGSPTPHLALVQGRDVVIVPDADAATNIRVFAGATNLGDACREFGAGSVKFARLPGGGRDGLDDILARLDDGNRQPMLESWVAGAKSKPADLDKRAQQRMWRELKQKEMARAAAAAEADHDFGGRLGVDVDGDPREISLTLTAALVDSYGGTSVFRMANRLARLRRDEAGALAASPLDGDASLHRLLLEVACPYRKSGDGLSIAHEPVSTIYLGLVADRCDEFPVLNGVTRSPVVRPDGTISTVAGYDSATGLFLDPSPDIQGITVPDHPNDAEIAAATALLRDDLLARDLADDLDGWVFKSEADQTNAAGALITTVVRSATGPSPLVLFDGLQPGVGKGGLLETIHRVAYGVAPALQATPKSDEEMDKRIIAELMEGSTSMVLDEVQDEDGYCRLKSGALRTGLTADAYRGRKLGVSEMKALPNRACWWALGNNVQIPADMARRVVPVQLESDRPGLENRSNFRHNDLSAWVARNRAELLRAVLVLVRAWFDRGQPEAPKDFGFASFSEWQRIVGGILYLAGFKGFLSNVMEVRAASDNRAAENVETWGWIFDTFAQRGQFSAAQVLAAAKADADAPPPYGHVSWDDLTAKALSTYFGQHRQWYGDLRIVAAGKVHGGSKAYRIERLPAGVTALPASPGPMPPPTPPAAPGPRTGAGAAPGEEIEFVDRRGSRQRIGRAMPTVTGSTIAELEGA